MSQAQTQKQGQKEINNEKSYIFDLSEKQRILLIVDCIIKGAENVTVRDFTVNILKDKGFSLYPFSFSQIQVIYDFVSNDIKYVKDINRVETIYAADKCLKYRYGDCDDKVVLGGAMLRTLGYEIALVLLDTLSQVDYQHIYLWVEYDNKWVAFDTCIVNGSVGQEIKNFKRKKIMPIY